MSDSYFQDARMYFRRGFRKWSRKTSQIIAGSSAVVLANNFWSGGPNPIGPRIAHSLLSFVRYRPTHNPLLFAIMLTSTGVYFFSIRAKGNPKKGMLTNESWEYARFTSGGAVGTTSAALVRNFVAGGPNPVGLKILKLLGSFVRFSPNPYFLALTVLSTGVYLYIRLTDEEEEPGMLVAGKP